MELSPLEVVLSLLFQLEAEFLSLSQLEVESVLVLSQLVAVSFLSL